jgi:hypothetical protein
MKRPSIEKPSRKAIYPSFSTENDVSCDLSCSERSRRLISHLQRLLRDGEGMVWFRWTRRASARMTVTGGHDGHF